MKISILLIGILVIISLTGCASPGIRCRIKDENTVVFEPKKKEGLLSFFFPSTLPQGIYAIEKTQNFWM